MTAAHPDATAFLSAINAAPADDAPRLVYADWLDDHAGGGPCPICSEWSDDTFNRNTAAGIHTGCHGRVANGFADRASFIRCQIELARLERRYAELREIQASNRGNSDLRVLCEIAANHESRDALRARERELFRANSLRWWPDLQSWVRKLDHENVETPRPTTPMAIVRRGFVATARLTCAAFLGGPCPRCYRGTYSPPDGYPMDCPACAGSGTTPGLAATLATHPVEQVVLTDREPHATYIEASGERCWAWWKAGNGPAASQLPPELWNVLVPPGRAYPVAWDEITVFNRPSLEAAHAALGAAAVAHLRRQGE